MIQAQTLVHDIEVTLAALYVRGAPRPFDLSKRGWPTVLRSLRTHSVSLPDVSEVLRSVGLHQEALAVESSELLSWAHSRVSDGEVLTAASPDYPTRWLDVLGGAAPPALWVRGLVPRSPFFSVVGSRSPSSANRRVAADCAREAVRLGFSVCSGGAAGVDRAAKVGAGLAAIEIVPFGLDHVRGDTGSCFISVCAPWEGFSSATAMERNALIYAASSHTLVVQPRYKEGGTWHGATNASRKKLTRLLQLPGEDQATRSLLALGARTLNSVSDLENELRNPEIEARLLIA